MNFRTAATAHTPHQGDGGCYEVCALGEKGERVEAYFDPKTLDLVSTSRYP